MSDVSRVWNFENKCATCKKEFAVCDGHNQLWAIDRVESADFDKVPGDTVLWCPAYEPQIDYPMLLFQCKKALGAWKYLLSLHKKVVPTAYSLTRDTAKQLTEETLSSLDKAGIQ